MPAPGTTTLIDAVNDSNEPVGTVPRGDVFRVRANFRTVHVLVINRSGELLLQRLGATRQRHPLCWGSSVAGYLHAGEDYRAAAVRRAGEELGIGSKVVDLGVSAMQDDGVTKFIGVFETFADDPRVADPDHIDDIRFWSVSEVDREVRKNPERFTPTFRHVFAYWRSRHPHGPLDAGE